MPKVYCDPRKAVNAGVRRKAIKLEQRFLNGSRFIGKAHEIIEAHRIELRKLNGEGKRQLARAPLVF